ncbi:MAG: hypothetical protein A2887_05575 [Alphaproteobacteria bacterium RIFCSPLOWO2_01_FULL_40_26]|nr:MAG: hypothetical protein A3D15_06030 [Alphaproteobacteria bacterium RIFCSPHIGHO2_02_FULL_40_34]OFW85866.1 MAG: hypothetical protein A2794_02935 [Alphaproteobacteria bacterium RIFCSPHIGHO2_01_FULL_40_8]OFW94201.1 MAG: hypothetical protein A2887_05575 [Alphaproteobacteria bacterium RIFCSPLOWO2_01_FULL_40_26]OFX09770.1 MAG: hypothetical protein A3H30_00335 [Alphaproteobacteria bacterium RIFCSPLOWO2_02_FULL_40_19]OFX12229.1 MAG: hypothetical protein A3G22_01785 [Alphaproteobacteria bacterium RI
MKIYILTSVKHDLLDGYRFYERQMDGLGVYFLDSIFSDIESLLITAGVHSIHFGYHRLLSKRFPFAVYYRCEKRVVKIYAVLDCRKNPSWTRDKLN